MVPQCKSKPQKKISNHLSKFHPDLTPNERKRYLRKATVVEKTHIREEPGQSKLSLAQNKVSPTPGHSLATKTEDKLKKGKTRSLGKFPSSHPELASYKQYLMGLAGKKKSDTSAESIVTDISKMLYYHNEKELQWENVTDRDKLLKYIDKIDQMKVGPEGQLTKLERVHEVFRYLKRTKKHNVHLMEKIQETESDIQDWKKTLRSAKRSLQIKRMEETSEMNMNLEEITAVVDNPRMWTKFSDVVSRAKHRENVAESELKLAMGIVMLTVKLKSFQRPGAVTNCTIREYRNAEKCGDTTVINVYNHKTGNQGAAKLTMDAKLSSRLLLYFKYIRPLLMEPGEDIDNLFILPGSQKVGKFGNLEASISRFLNVQVPSSTKARKIGATCSAKALDYQTHHLVTQQMSHQADVSRKYYEAVHGKRDAAFAFQKLEGLRTGSKAGTSETGGLASQRWSTLDTAFVKKKFAACIKKARTPGLPECSEIGLDRTAKQVQDKVRTLIRQAQKKREDSD